MLLSGGSATLSSVGAIAVSGGTLDLGGQGQSTSGRVSFQGGVVQDGTLTETGTAAFDAQSGSVSVVLAGTAGLNKTTAGVVTLTAKNTFTGTTTVSGGELLLAGGSSTLSTIGGITSTGGTLDLGGQGQGTSGAISFQGGVVQDGTLTQTGTAAFDAQSGSVSAVLAGTAGLNKTTAGVVTLTAKNTFTGTTTVSGGELLLAGGSNTLSTIAGITSTGGTLDLGGQGQSTSGAISFQGGAVQNGTLTQTGTAAFDAQSGSVSALLAGAAGLNKTTAGTFVLTASNTFTGGTTVGGGVLLLGGSNVLNTAGGITTTGGTLDLDGQGQSTSGAISFQGGVVQDGTLTQIGAAAFDARSGTVGAVLAGAVGLNKTTSGTVVLSGNNTYSGGTVLIAGVLQLAARNTLNPAGGITISGGTLDLGGLGQSTSGAVTFQGGGVQNGTLTQTGAAPFDAQSGTITAVLAGAVGLNKTTAGTVVLGGNNTYSGLTTIAGGTLQVGGAPPGSGGAPSGSGGLAGNVLDNGSLVFNRSDAAVFAGNISGSGGVTQAGAGVLVLTGSNACGGGTTISFGTLQVGNSGNAGSLGGSVIDNAALVFNRADAYTFAGTVSGSGVLCQAGAGMLTLAGANACGSTCVSAGTLAVNAMLVNQTATIAGGPGATAVVVAQSGSLWTTSASLLVGGTGPGSLVVQAGGAVSGNTLSVAAAGTLCVNPGGLVNAATILNGAPSGSGNIYLNGGVIRATAFVGRSMTFNLGTLEYTGGLAVSAADWLESTLGPGRPIGFAQQFQVDGTTTLNDVLTLSGGTFSTARLVNPSYLQFESGTFNLTGDNLVIGAPSGSGGSLGGNLALPAGSAVNVSGSASIAAGASLVVQGGAFTATALLNSGTIGGSGQINAPLTNAPGGLVRALTTDHPVFTAGSNVNQGQIQIFGGAVEFTGGLVNGAPSGSGGLIQGTGRLIVGGGLVNSGSMTFSAYTNVSGAVQNNASGLVNTAGGTTTFWNDVANNGTIRTSIGSFTVFYGAVSGSGAFTGPGTASFESDLSLGAAGTTYPGAASISIASQAYFDDSSRLDIQLAGAAAGTQYDQVNVAGTATLAGGALNVSLVDGFRPAHNEQFTVLTFGSRSGDFGTETGLDLGQRLELVPSYTGKSLVLTAMQGGSGAWRSNVSGPEGAPASVPGNWSGGIPNAPGDTATFGEVITQPQTVAIDQPITLGGVVLDSPYGYTLSGGNSLTFDNSGSGARITVSGGRQAINAPIVLADDLSVESGPADAGPWTLVLGRVPSGCGGVAETGGSRSLTMNGADGTLILSGTSSYTGGTNVNVGTLVLANNTAMPDGTALTIGGGGTFVFDPTQAVASSLPVVAPVPEPNAIVLLAAAIWSAVIYCRFHFRPKTFRMCSEQEAAWRREQGGNDHAYMVPVPHSK